MCQAVLSPNLTNKFQWEVSQIADNRFPCVMLLGGLSVNLNHLKTRLICSESCHHLEWSQEAVIDLGLSSWLNSTNKEELSVSRSIVIGHLILSVEYSGGLPNSRVDGDEHNTIFVCFEWPANGKYCWNIKYEKDVENIENKKVLLRECKRYTARHVASTPYVVLTGSPPGRVPPGRVPPRQGTPLAGYPPGWVPPRQGTPPGRVPPTRVPPHQGTPPAGYPSRLDLAGYPPPAAPWHSGKCCKALWDMGTPPVNRQIDGWMDRCVSKHYLPVVLRTRAVKTQLCIPIPGANGTNEKKTTLENSVNRLMPISVTVSRKVK